MSVAEDADKALIVGLGADRPSVDFVIVGAQKCGTTALAHFLGQHPDIGMASPSEVHMFDGPEYSRRWTRSQIDARYAPYFRHCDDELLRGESTPIYMYLPGVVPELKRYNPDMKLIVLLRDPVERAISNYHMEKNRGVEYRSLWLALLAEPFRLNRCKDPRPFDSALRCHSYRRRGLYSHQLRNVYQYFDRDRVLVLRSNELRNCHRAVLERVFTFLGLSTCEVAPAVVRKGNNEGARWVVRFLLRLSFAAEFARLRALKRRVLIGSVARS